MAYAPNNNCVFLKAFAGAAAGLGASGRFLLDPLAADFSVPAQMADAYAQQFDTSWGGAAVTKFEEDAIFQNSKAVWENHSPLENSVAFTPGSYASLVTSVIALVVQSNTQVAGEGVDPNACAAIAGVDTWTFFGPVAVPTTFAPTSSQNFVAVDSTGAGQVTINAPSPSDGQNLVVADWKGNAALKPIKIAGLGGFTVADPGNPGNYGSPVAISTQGGVASLKASSVQKKWLSVT